MSEELKNYGSSAIAEMTGGIILARYEKESSAHDKAYQSEADLERELIENLISQGYERFKASSNEDLYRNLRDKIEKLNKVSFTDDEWRRFLTEYLDAPNDGIVEKTRKIQENYIYDFKFDNSDLKNIKIIDKKNIHNNFMQVMNQFAVDGHHKNRYDVTILVNGLPLVHIERLTRKTFL